MFIRDRVPYVVRDFRGRIVHNDKTCGQAILTSCERCRWHMCKPFMTRKPTTSPSAEPIAGDGLPPAENIVDLIHQHPDQEQLRETLMDLLAEDLAVLFIELKKVKKTK